MIPQDDSSSDGPLLDLLIVGAGPAGLAASCAAQDAGLAHLVVERRGPTQSLVEHPQQIRYFSPADELAIGGVPFPVAGGHRPTREDALAYYRAVAASRRLPLATWEEVTGVARVGPAPPLGHFRVRSIRRRAGAGEVVRRARFLLVCSGTFPNPRRLDVPGADLPKVLARLDDPTPFFGRDVLVAGGGNSAATAAMTLAEAGARVTVAMRRAPADFQSHLRPFIVRDLTIMAEEKRLSLVSGVRVARITPDSVELACAPYGQEPPPDGGARRTLPNDFVFALIGHTADLALFAHLGVPLAPDGLPVYDEESSESAVPGLYLAGSLSRANIILESRRRAAEIVAHVAARLAALPGRAPDSTPDEAGHP
jgi:thioredoxin reductase (NADPH)